MKELQKRLACKLLFSRGAHPLNVLTVSRDMHCWNDLADRLMVQFLCLNHLIRWTTSPVALSYGICCMCDWTHTANVCRFTSMSRLWRHRATTMHRPSDIFDTCWPRNWHRHWLAVLSSPGLTTAMLCSTALQVTASRSCSEYRTMQLESFLEHQDDPMLARCWGRYTGCPSSRGSITKWLCWHSKSAAPRPRSTCDS